MTGPDVFQPQLRPGERVLWNAPESATLKDAQHRRGRRQALLVGVACAAMGAFCAWKVYESVIAPLTRPSTPSASDTFIWALLVAGGLFWGAIGVAALRASVLAGQHYFISAAAYRITSTWQFHYVLTDQRLFCVDETGELADEIEGSEIVGVEMEGEPPATVLVERRVWENEEDKYLALMDLEQPSVAKAKIEETFLEPTP